MAQVSVVRHFSWGPAVHCTTLERLSGQYTFVDELARVAAERARPLEAHE